MLRASIAQWPELSPPSQDGDLMRRRAFAERLPLIDLAPIAWEQPEAPVSEGSLLRALAIAVPLSLAFWAGVFAAIRWLS